MVSRRQVNAGTRIPECARPRAQRASERTGILSRSDTGPLGGVAAPEDGRTPRAQQASEGIGTSDEDGRRAPLNPADALWREAPKQLRDVFGLAGQHEAGGDLIKRLQDKPPLMGAWMRQCQFRSGAGLASERDQVQIERAGFVENLLGLASKFFFDDLEFRKQRFRCLARLRRQAHDSVYKGWRSGRTIDRRGLPKRRPEQRLVRDSLQPIHRPQHVLARFTDIRAERDDRQTGVSRFPIRPACFHFSPSTSCMS